MIGGMISSTLLTLPLSSAIYALVKSRQALSCIEASGIVYLHNLMAVAIGNRFIAVLVCVYRWGVVSAARDSPLRRRKILQLARSAQRLVSPKWQQ